MNTESTSDKALRRPAFRLASFDPATGKARNANPVMKPEPLAGAQLASVLEAIEFRPMNGSGTLTEHVTLSARHPWVDGKGWIDAINPRSFFADSPNIGFVPEAGHPEGRIEVWLDGLAASSTYMFQILVSSPGSGQFQVTAVTLGGGYASANTDAEGGAQTLFGLFESVDGGLGMIRVSCPDWVFFEAVISRFE